MTEVNVKRSRLLLEKKKKQFYRWPVHNNDQAAANVSAEVGGAQSNPLSPNGGLMIGNGANNATRIGFPTEVGKPILNVDGNLVCVPGITYKSMLPAKVAQAKQQAAMKIVGDSPN